MPPGKPDLGLTGHPLLRSLRCRYSLPRGCLASVPALVCVSRSACRCVDFVRAVAAALTSSASCASMAVSSLLASPLFAWHVFAVFPPFVHGRFSGLSSWSLPWIFFLRQLRPGVAASFLMAIHLVPTGDP